MAKGHNETTWVANDVTRVDTNRPRYRRRRSSSVALAPARQRRQLPHSKCRSLCPTFSSPSLITSRQSATYFTNSHDFIHLTHQGSVFSHCYYLFDRAGHFSRDTSTTCLACIELSRNKQRERFHPIIPAGFTRKVEMGRGGDKIVHKEVPIAKYEP